MIVQEREGKSARGFASMDHAKQKEIARKGGLAVSQNRAHMSEIGKKGGEASHTSRAAKGIVGRIPRETGVLNPVSIETQETIKKSA